MRIEGERAEDLQRGDNVIDVERTRSSAQESAQLERIFDRLCPRPGPVARGASSMERGGSLVEKDQPPSPTPSTSPSAPRYPKISKEQFAEMAREVLEMRDAGLLSPVESELPKEPQSREDEGPLPEDPNDLADEMAIRAIRRAKRPPQAPKGPTKE